MTLAVGLFRTYRTLSTKVGLGLCCSRASEQQTTLALEQFAFELFTKSD